MQFWNIRGYETTGCVSLLLELKVGILWGLYPVPFYLAQTSLEALEMHKMWIHFHTHCLELVIFLKLSTFIVATSITTRAAILDFSLQ